jgi:hypothetical protein
MGGPSHSTASNHQRQGDYHIRHHTSPTTLRPLLSKPSIQVLPLQVVTTRVCTVV